MKPEYLALFTIDTSIFTFFVSGFGAYMGVRIALAELKERQVAHSHKIADHDERIKYLERSLSAKG